jgi:hypothetical protein
MANDMNRIRGQTLILAAALLLRHSQPAVAQMRTVATPRGDTETYSVLLGENFRVYTDRVLEQPMSQDNTIYSCDFVYDARTRKTCVRSLNVVEVGDPGDIRFWRMPGQYPNTPFASDGWRTTRLSVRLAHPAKRPKRSEATRRTRKRCCKFFTRNKATRLCASRARTGMAK